MPKIVDHDQRRRELVAALWDVVNTKGASAVSIRSVAAAAGIPKSNVVYYFPSRGRLLAAAVDTVLGSALTVGQEVIAERLTVDGVIRILMFTVPTTPARRRQAEVWQLLNVERSGDPELSKLLDDFNENVASRFVILVERMATDGLLAPARDVHIEARLLHALTDGLSLQTMANPKRLPPRRIEELLRSHVEGLAS